MLLNIVWICKTMIMYLLYLEVFEYRLEHSSQPISSEDRIKEKRILSEVGM